MVVLIYQYIIIKSILKFLFLTCMCGITNTYIVWKWFQHVVKILKYALL